MSLESWKAQYYPIPAEDFTHLPDIEIVDAAILKWEGLRPQALTDHDLVKGYRTIFGKPHWEGSPYGMDIGSGSCAFCLNYIESDCTRCPLKIVRGERCDEQITDDEPAPYVAWRKEGDAEPMIGLLKAAKEYLIANSDPRGDD